MSPGVAEDVFPTQEKLHHRPGMEVLPQPNHFIFVRHFGFVIINNTVGIQILDKSGFRILRGVQCVNGPVLEWSAWPIKYPVT